MQIKFGGPGSSSGRTKDSGSFNGGSNPSPGEFKDTFRCLFSYGGSSNHRKFFVYLKTFLVLPTRGTLISKTRAARQLLS